MNEPLTSNQLCKHRHPDGSWTTWIFDECPRCQIERLTAERDKLLLDLDNARACSITEIRAERDQLRAALQEIASVLPHDGYTAWTGWVGQMDRIARKALAGAAVGKSDE